MAEYQDAGEKRMRRFKESARVCDFEGLTGVDACCIRARYCDADIHERKRRGGSAAMAARAPGFKRQDVHCLF